MTQLTIASLFNSNFLTDNSFAQSLGEDFNLCDNGNMVFRWADFHETCTYIKENLQNDQGLKDDFLKREASVNHLAKVPVWIKTSAKIHQLTMHALYECYILNQSHLMGIDPFGQIEISFISGTGPFKSMALSECFNKNTYMDFVMLYLLDGKLPRRDYRIRLKAKVLLEFGNKFERAELIHLEQMTSHGLLLSIDSDLYNEICKTSNMRILIDTEVLKNGCDKGLRELQSYFSQYAFNLMYSSRKQDGINCNLANFKVNSSFDFIKNKKVYIFTPYDQIHAGNPEGVHNIQRFIEHTKVLIREHYRDMAGFKSA